MALEDWKEVLALSAVITTVLQFLAGTLICQKFVQKGTTGDVSCTPFVSGFLSASLWLRYGFLIQNHSVILVNTVGSTLMLAYCFTYLIYSIKKSLVLRQLFIVSLILTAIFTYTTQETNHELVVFRMGLACSLMTVTFFASPLTSLLYVIKMKSTEILPFPIIVTSFFVSLLWWLYGIIISDIFLQVTNFCGFLLSSFQLSLYLCYPNSPKPVGGYGILNQQQL